MSSCTTASSLTILYSLSFISHPIVVAGFWIFPALPFLGVQMALWSKGMIELDMLFQVFICCECNVTLFTKNSFNVKLAPCTPKMTFQRVICIQCKVTFFTMTSFSGINVFDLCVILHFCFHISLKVTVITLINAVCHLDFTVNDLFWFDRINLPFSRRHI